MPINIGCRPQNCNHEKAYAANREIPRAAIAVPAETRMELRIYLTKAGYNAFW